MTLTPTNSFLVTATSQGTSLVSPSFTPATGDIIVVKAAGEDSTLHLNTPTASANTITWTLQQSDTTSSHTSVYMWTGAVTTGGSSCTVTVSTVAGGSAQLHSMMCERWSGSTCQLAASPALNKKVSTSAGTATSSLTTTAAGSVISWMNADWGANSPASATYANSANNTSEGIHDGSPNNYVAYYDYLQAPTAGATTYGVTAPTGQTYSLLAIEIQPASSGSNFSASPSLTGSGALSTTVTPSIPKAAALGGTGTLSSSVVPAVTASAALTGTGSLSATVVPAVTATAALTGTGTLTATTTPSIATTAALAGTGTLSATTTPATSTTGALGGTGTLTATNTPALATTAGLTGTGTLSTGNSFTASPNLTGSGALTATNTPAVSTTAALTSTGSLSTGNAFSGSGTLGGSGSLTTSGIPAVAAAAALSGSGALAVAVVPALASSAALGGTGSLAATTKPGVTASAALSGTGTLSLAAITLALSGSAALTGSGSLVGTIIPTNAHHLDLTVRLLQPRWKAAVPDQPRWFSTLRHPRWKAAIMGPITIPAATAEYLPISVVKNGSRSATNISSGCQYSIVAGVATAPGSWTACTVVDGNPAAWIGSLTAGTYTVFIQITASPEVIVRNLGQITLT